MATHDLDASFLMWDIRRNLHVGYLPPQVVIYFEFADAKKEMKQWWLVVELSEVDVCVDDPGREVNITLVSSLRTMTRIWMGDLSLGQARAQGLLKVSDATALTHNLGKWLGASPFAHVQSMARKEATRV